MESPNTNPPERLTFSEYPLKGSLEAVPSEVAVAEILSKPLYLGDGIDRSREVRHAIAQVRNQQGSCVVMRIGPVTIGTSPDFDPQSLRILIIDPAQDKEGHRVIVDCFMQRASTLTQADNSADSWQLTAAKVPESPVFVRWDGAKRQTGDMVDITLRVPRAINAANG